MVDINIYHLAIGIKVTASQVFLYLIFYAKTSHDNEFLKKWQINDVTNIDQTSAWL